MATSQTLTYTIYNRDTVSADVTSMIFTSPVQVSHHIGFPVTWNPPYGGDTNFTSTTTVSTLVTIAPSSSETFTAYYSNNSGVPGLSYTATFVIHTLSSVPTIQYVTNIIGINTAPVDSAGTGTGGDPPVTGDGVVPPDESVTYTPETGIGPGDGDGGGGSAAGGGGSASGPGSGCVIATELTRQGVWTHDEYVGLTGWARTTLDKSFLGRCLHYGYPVVASRIFIPAIKQRGTLKAQYCTWVFNNSVAMLRGRKFDWLAIPSLAVWIGITTTVGLFISKKQHDSRIKRIEADHGNIN